MAESVLSNQCSKHKLFTFQESKILKMSKKTVKIYPRFKKNMDTLTAVTRKLFLEATNYNAHTPKIHTTIPFRNLKCGVSRVPKVI